MKMKEAPAFSAPAKHSLFAGFSPARLGPLSALSLAVLVVAIALFFALGHEPRPDPFTAVTPWTTDWWRYPLERNAFKRLPVIAGKLKAIHAARDGRRLWAVGQAGLIVHSTDGGQTWIQQTWTPQPARPSPAATETPAQWQEPTPQSAPTPETAPQPNSPSQQMPIPNAAPSSGKGGYGPTYPEKGGTLPYAQQQYAVPSGQDLRIVQEQLNLLGLYSGPMDGSANPALEKAIKAFQESRKLPADGIAGPQTLRELEDATAVQKKQEQRQTNPPPQKNVPNKAMPKATSTAPSLFSLVPEALAEVPPVQQQARPPYQKERQPVAVEKMAKDQAPPPPDPGALPDLNAVSFLPDGATGWAVGKNGTILHTTNAGASWDPQVSGSTGTFLSVAFTDANTGWAVADTGSILHTTDAGATWTVRESGTKATLHAIAFPDASIGWAAGSNGTILHTTDTGASWTSTKAIDMLVDLTGVAFTSTSIGWAVGSQFQDASLVSIILHTTDAGASWTSVVSNTKAILQSIAFTDDRTGWAVDDIGSILHTKDGGVTWAPQTSGRSANLESVVFTDTRTGWAVGSNGTILRTTDAGSSWTRQPSPTTGNISSVAFLDSRTGWAVAGSNIIHTKDGGSSWTSLTHDTGVPITSVFFTDARTGWAVGGTMMYDGVILHSTDAGITWSDQALLSNSFLASVFFIDARIGWAVGDYGNIHYTTNGGVSWTKQASTTNEHLSSVVFTDTRTGWVVGKNGTILHTADAGDSWTAQPNGRSAHLQSVAFTDARTGWAVGSAGTVLHTTDAGVTWTLQASGTQADLQTVDFYDARVGWAVGDYGTILHTIDGGRTWLGGEEPKARPFVLYGRYPAPWFWLVALVVLVTAGAWSGHCLRKTGQERRQPSIIDTGVSDDPIRRAEQDRLGFGPMAQAVAAFLRNAGTSPPLMLAITAPWGRGKSSMMHLLRGALEEGGVRCIWFNAWHQQKEDVLLVPLLDAIRQQGFPRLLSRDGLRFRSRLAARRVRTRPWLAATVVVLLGVGVGHYLPAAWQSATKNWEQSATPAAKTTAREGLVPGEPRMAEARPAAREGLVTGAPRMAEARPAAREGLVPGEPRMAEARPAASDSGLVVRTGDRVIRFGEDLLLGAVIRMAAVADAKAVQDLLALQPGDFAEGLMKSLREEPEEFADLLAFAGSLLGLYLFAAFFYRAFPESPSSLLASASSRFRLGEAEAQTSFRNRFRVHFADVTAALGPRWLTVFIDDLDRCDAAKSVEMLEAVNYLASNGNCFVVLGIAREIVEAQVARVYADVADQQRKLGLLRAVDAAGRPLSDEQSRRQYALAYLRKLIQIEVAVPQFSHENLANLVRAEQKAAGNRTRRERVWKALENLWAWTGRIAPKALLLLLAFLTTFAMTKSLEKYAQKRTKEVAAEQVQLQQQLARSRETEREAVAFADAADEADKAARSANLADNVGRRLRILADQAREAGQRATTAVNRITELGGKGGLPAQAKVLKEEVEKLASARKDAEQFGKAITAILAPQPARDEPDGKLPPPPSADTGGAIGVYNVRTEDTWGPAAFPIGVLVAAILVLLFWRDDYRFYDSPSFAQAMELWQPMLAPDPDRSTPREVKRFLNRARYAAARLRGSSRMLSRVQVLLRWLGLKHREVSRGVPALEVPEEKIVALAAVYHAKPTGIGLEEALFGELDQVAAEDGTAARAFCEQVRTLATQHAQHRGKTGTGKDGKVWDQITQGDVTRFLDVIHEFSEGQAQPVPADKEQQSEEKIQRGSAA